MTQSTLAPRRHELRPNSRDISALTDLVRKGARAGQEVLDQPVEHLDRVVTKPWGYESRVFVDDFIDVWHLSISAGEGTSMHSHPRKQTQLLCLAGSGVTDTLDASVEVTAGTVLRIGAGVFHATRATGTEPLHLIEVETPRNKFDLMRLRDSYDRHATSYERDGHENAGVARLRSVAYLPHTRMRARSPENAFTFAIRAGMDLFYRPQPGDLFHIPLGLAGVVLGQVEVVGAADRDPDLIATDQYYLSIARSLTR